MSEQRESARGEQSEADRMSALFAQLVLQQTNMAMMLLGKIAHPESGQVYKDTDAARLFIDQLEMLETKTRGNLSNEEARLLKQSLMNLRMAFVEAVEEPRETKSEAANPAAAEATGQGTESASNTPEPGKPADDEHRKKFSKKY